MAELNAHGLRRIPRVKSTLEALVPDRSLDVIPVNVSEFYRTQQTAQEIGFQIFQTLPILNESVEDVPIKELLGLMKQGWLPDEGLDQAEQFLNNPNLHAEFNFTHGVFVACCRYVAGERPDDGNMRRLVPFYGEVVEINT